MSDEHSMLFRNSSSALLVSICGAGEAHPQHPLYDAVLRACPDVSFLSFAAEKWNDSLSPWPAEAVRGGDAFGGKAADTLDELISVIGASKEEYSLDPDIPVIIGGYSLAGLFALWSAYQTDIFTGVAAASPSVWYPGWLEYASSHIINTDYVYLSLGDKEAKTRNRTMSAVQSCIEKEYEDLRSSPGIKNAVLEYNPGNHFTDPEGRLAKAFIWNIQQIKNNNHI